MHVQVATIIAQERNLFEREIVTLLFGPPTNVSRSRGAPNRVATTDCELFNELRTMDMHGFSSTVWCRNGLRCSTAIVISRPGGTIVAEGVDVCLDGVRSSVLWRQWGNLRLEGDFRH